MINKNEICFLRPRLVQPTKPLFVYLPGMDGTGELLTTQTNKLAQTFDLCCLSIPAYDLSDWDTLSNKTTDLIQQEIATLPSRMVYLCGESFGGSLALRISLAAPELSQRLILVNPASSFHQRPILSLGINLIPWLPSYIHKTSAIGLLPFLAELSRIETKERRALLQAMRSLPQEVVSWRLSLLQSFVVSEQELTSIKQPTLVVAGGADKLLPSVEEANRLVKALPQGQMTILPQSGHACLLEAETNLYEILGQNNFLESKQFVPS
ncbi:MAG: alpha/beta hydrolase [Xenococcaceae cyanobacterium MO_188.B29]|nr:alpha/beta hydrolase [Xenococcaceae cyanobacterium MO_188.B29]